MQRAGLVNYGHGAILFLFFGACVALIPYMVEARFIDANVQCPPGGKKNQPCTDNTNGYTTKGTCSFVYVCKANQVDPKTPPPCSPGSADCPKGTSYPPAYTPTPRPIQIASTSEAIPHTAVSSFEQGILDAVFDAESNDIRAAVDVEEVIASANTQLRALAGDSAEELLSYVPESFATDSSTLFASLRDAAVTLSPGSLHYDQVLDLQNGVKVAFATGGSFGSVAAHTSGSNGKDSNGSDPYELQGDWHAFSRAADSMANAIVYGTRSLAALLLADFSVAGDYGSFALERFKTSLALLGGMMKDAVMQAWLFLYHLLYPDSV